MQHHRVLNHLRLLPLQRALKAPRPYLYQKYKQLINNTLGDPERAKRFVGAITSAVAVNPELQKCEAGTILAGALLGESLNLSPSPT